MLSFSSAQAHEAQREEGFLEQAMLQTSLGGREVNCHIIFPVDAKLEYLTSWSNEGADQAHCEFNGNKLLNYSPNGIVNGHHHNIKFFDGIMRCKFKVTFSDGNECSCEVTTKNLSSSDVRDRYTISHDGCECMRITRCDGNDCAGDDEWPCGGYDGCYWAPQVTLHVDSSWN